MEQRRKNIEQKLRFEKWTRNGKRECAKMKSQLASGTSLHCWNTISFCSWTRLTTKDQKGSGTDSWHVWVAWFWLLRPCLVCDTVRETVIQEVPGISSHSRTTTNRGKSRNFNALIFYTKFQTLNTYTFIWNLDTRFQIRKIPTRLPSQVWRMGNSLLNRYWDRWCDKLMYKYLTHTFESRYSKASKRSP